MKTMSKQTVLAVDATFVRHDARTDSAIFKAMGYKEFLRNFTGNKQLE